MNNSLEKLHFMTSGFIWRLWTNCPPPNRETRRGGHKCTNFQASQGQWLGGGISSKSKINVYYHRKWTSPMKNCTLWLEASSEDSEPTVAPSPPLPPPHTHTHTHTTGRQGEEVTNVQMPSSSKGRLPGRPLVSALRLGIKWINPSSSPRE